MSGAEPAAGLAATLRLYRPLLECVPDALVLVDAEGKIVLANGLAENLFGYASGELAGLPVDQLVPPRFRRQHQGHRAGFFSNPKLRAMGSRTELLGLRKDGTEFSVAINLAPIQTASGLLVSAAIRDVSEIQRTVHQLQVSREHAEEADRLKSQFLANMSHELRTPLNAIIGFTGTLLMKLPGALNAAQEEQLNIVQSSARHLLSLINDLLDLAKIESGKRPLRPETVACRALLVEIAATLRPQAEKKGLQLTLEAPEGEIRVVTDARALKQIVLNLCHNAIQFTDSGSVTLELRVSGDHLPLEIGVTDTGIGIRAEDQDKLFKVFSQVDSTHREGTGLGLHLSQKLAQLISGTIQFRSAAGRGSRFWLTLPRSV